MILLLAPISTLAIALHAPVVYFVFSHTKMKLSDIQATAACLAFSVSACLPGECGAFFSRGFYAIEDTITPAVVGTIMTVLSLPVHWFLSYHWQHEGLATASSIGVISYRTVIFCLLVRRTKNAEASGLVRFFAKIVAICAVSSLACQRLAQWLQPKMAWQNSLGALELIVPVCLVVLLLMVLLAISHRGIRKSLPEALDLAARAHSDVGGLNLRFYRLHKNETLDHL